MAAQSDSQGFLADSSLKLLARNFYWNYNGRDGNADRREWGQGFQLDYASGYTQGPVGLGVDLSAYQILKVGGSEKHAGRIGLLVSDGDGVSDSASSAGASVKLRVSETELRYGNNLRPYTPVFAPSDGRLVPATATGFWLTSQEVDGLLLEAGHMTAAKDFNGTNSSDNFYASYAGVGTSTVDFFGGTYGLNDQISLGLYGADYKDIWKQYYGNFNFTQPLSDSQSLNFDFNIYKTGDSGAALAGEIDTLAYSLAASYSISGHTFTLTYQKNDGDTPFDYLGMGPGTYHDSIYLANSSQLVDFNGPNERSWGIFYDLDMTAYGVPGLSFSTRYIKGTDVDASDMPAGSPYAYYGDSSSEEHWERDFQVKYVIQSGSFKDLSLRFRQATHRIGNGASDSSSDLFRIIVEYPYDFF
ncbi:OprD family porin [Pseudomonas sp. NY15367]